jgi:aminoglycoside phosphotransferase family enzyme
LTGKYAYKIKKPVNFGFLDFSTLEKRQFYCYEFEKESVSDGRLETFDEIKEDFEEVSEVPSQNHIIIDTSDLAVEKDVSKVLRELRNG